MSLTDVKPLGSAMLRNAERAKYLVEFGCSQVACLRVCA
jgi:hypothetical protein